MLRHVIHSYGLYYNYYKYMEVSYLHRMVYRCILFLCIYCIGYKGLCFNNSNLNSKVFSIIIFIYFRYYD